MFLDTVSFLELINTAARIDKLLLAGKEGMALVADIHFKRFDVLGSTCLESCAASAYYRNFVIVRMYIGLHIFTSLLILNKCLFIIIKKYDKM